MNRRYSLDNESLCFLSFFYTEQKELYSISFDVEAADDYHYQIYADQFPKLCEYFNCNNNESDFTSAFTESLKKMNNPINMSSVLRRAGIEFRTHYWH